MTRLPHACVDMRAFSWRLLPLERKLGWERDASRGRLAQALRAVRESQGQLDRLQALTQEQGVAAAASLQEALDPQSHRQVLHYLAGIQLRLRQVTGQLGRQEQDVTLARAACAECERRLQALVATRAQAMRTYIRAGLLREDRQADAAWLAHDQAFRAARGLAP